MDPILLFGKRSALLLLLGVTSAFFIACDEPERSAYNKSCAQSLDTQAQTAARLRALYFAQDGFAGRLEGAKLLSRFPDAAELVAWHVLTLSRSGDYKGATSYARAFRQNNPSDPWGKFALGGALLWNYQAETDEVLNATHAALLACPHHPDFIWLHAEALRVRNRNEDSLSFLNQRRATLTSHPELLNVKASALLGEFLADRTYRSRLSSALDTFARARQLDPGNVNSYFLPGKVWLQLQRPSRAYPLLKTAASLSAATRVQIAYWSSVLNRHDLSLADKRAEIDKSINEHLPNKRRDYKFLWAAAETYQELDMPTEQMALEERVLASDPDGPVAEDVLMSRIYAFAEQDDGDSPQLRVALHDFLDRKDHHNMRLFHQAQRMLFEVLKDDPNANPGELLSLVHDMSRGTAVTRTLAYSEGIAALARRDSLLGEAEELAKRGLAMISKASMGGHKEGVTLVPGENVPLLIEGAIRDGLGLVYLHQGRDDDAERELLAAYGILSKRPSILLNLARLYEQRRDYERAESFYIECAALPEAVNGPCSTALHEYYLRRHAQAEGIDSYRENVRPRLDKERKERILESKLSGNEAPLAITLQSLSGQTVSLAKMDGKMAVIQFWALWCEPCRIEMPAFARFAEQYTDADDVVVLTINGDPNPGIVREWMEEHDYNFEVLLYGGNLDKMVSGIPSAWFLDRSGRKVYEVTGMLGNLEQEYAARIELMRASANHSN